MVVQITQLCEGSETIEFCTLNGWVVLRSKLYPDIAIKKEVAMEMH
jgi:hypothetical protein